MRGFFCKAGEGFLRSLSRWAPDERGTYRLVRLVRRLRRREEWRGVFRVPQGFELELDLGTYPDCCMAFGVYELATARLIERLLGPGDHFVDGGANVGYFTLLAAQRVGDKGRVDAFEPQPENLARLRANLARNGMQGRVQVHAVALLDREDEVTIHYFLDAASNHGCASIFGREGVPSRSTRVPGRRMDQVLAGTEPKLVKLDIEGAEPLAVEGMRGLLQNRWPPRLIVEFNAVAARAAGFQPGEVIERVRTIRPEYRVWRIGRRLRPLEPRKEILERLGQCNLLLARPEDVPGL